MNLRFAKPIYKYYFIAFCLVLIDQISKITVKLNMRLGQEITIIDDFFKIHFIENPGAAFGMTFDKIFGGLSPEISKLILSLFSIAALGGLVFFLHKSARQPNKLPLWVSLILGGAMGNIIDRVFYGMWFAEINEYEGGFMQGRVVDMFYLDIWQGVLPESIPIIGGAYLFLWPIFNVADAAISTGIVLILIFQKQYFENIQTLPANRKTARENKTAEVCRENTPS